ncbi:MAG: response regulator transcription factor [Anaerolineae bacterium]|nr:response regulator transcription factor [Anaerolineae bacterium]
MTANEQTPIRILIADDHPVVRDGLAAILGTQPDFVIVGEAATGTELVAKAEALRPQIILTDLEMPAMDGIEAIQRLRERLPEIRVIVLTAFDTDDRIVGAIQAGASGYLLKGAPRNEIFEAIRVVSGGGTLIQSVVVSHLVRHIQAPSASTTEPLTERELEVLRLMAHGQLNKEIAAQLDITERTVKFHVSAILSKLNASNRTEAVHIALQQNVISLDSSR